MGKALGSRHCDSIYECGAVPEGPQSRVRCETLGELENRNIFVVLSLFLSPGNICPGLALSCTMCGIFTAGLCGPACTFAGLYCGVAGYSC